MIIRYFGSMTEFTCIQRATGRHRCNKVAGVERKGAVVDLRAGEDKGELERLKQFR